MFEQALLAAPRSGSRSATFVASFGAQILFVGTALLVPLFLIEGPGIVKLNPMLMAPPAPPPPPSVKLVEVPKQVARMFQNARLFSYTKIPDKVAAIVETDLPPEGAPMNIGVEGGVGGNGAGGVLDSILGQAARAVAPPPPPPKVEKPAAAEQPVQRIRQGGDVQGAKLIRRVIPPYPLLAKAARISGTVKLTGVINREGRIVQLQVISGHPLLVSAALEAVRQWVYEPTLLNGTPVEVIAPIDVNFTLSQ